MKAVRSHNYGGPEVFSVEEVPQPEPGPGQLLVAVKAAGVNPVDTYIRQGINNYSATFPHTPGSDGAGVVEAVGEGVSDFSPGDRVFFTRCLTGSSAEYTLCEPGKTFVLPKTLSFAEGAGLGVPAVTAFAAVFLRGQAQAGERVLIHGGSGAVGSLAVQLAKTAGLSVAATAGSEAGAELLRSLGADPVLNHHDSDYLAAWSTPDTGFDLIIEMLADVNLDRDLKALARFGRVVIVGSRGNVEITPRDTMARNADVRGLAVFNLDDRDFGVIRRRLVPMLESGSIKPVVNRTYALSEVGQAHEDVLSSGAAGNRVIDVEGSA